VCQNRSQFLQFFPVVFRDQESGGKTIQEILHGLTGKNEKSAEDSGFALNCGRTAFLTPYHCANIFFRYSYSAKCQQ
jgi:hypothetical protein